MTIVVNGKRKKIHATTTKQRMKELKKAVQEEIKKPNGGIRQA